ncbi:hypothetical protein KKA14_14585, partial [bacterium]|nr:hypothetical protein [bacterium]
SVDTNNGGRVIAPISIGIGRLVDCFNVPAEETNYYFLAPQWGADTSSDQMYRLMKDDQTWMWSDASPDNSLVSLPSLVAAEADEAFSIGPETANRYMNYFKIANLGHDAKFDPYCDDANGNGECDCKDLDGDKSCTLADEFTENTISEPPIWPGDNNASVIMDMLQTCGNKTGGSLAYCLKGIGLPSNTYFNQSIFECAENASRKIQWIDVTGMLAYGGGDADYGQGCSDVSADNYMGSLRLKNLIKRNNAYSIERPNKLMKLISTATATVGTGNPLASTAEVFNFQEALALVFLRLNLPVYSSVKDASHDSPYTNLDNDRVDGLSIYFKNVRLPGKQSDIASGLLRKFLEKAGTID